MGDVRGRAAVNKNSNTGSTAGGRYSKLTGAATKKAPIVWAQVSGPKIKDAIGFVTAVGDAITFGRTTDGGALSITVLSGAERLKNYATTPSEAEQLLDEIIAACGPDL